MNQTADESRIWRKAWPRGVAGEFTPDRPLAEMLRARAEEQPDAVALDFYGGRISYAELNQLIDRMANALTGLGLEPGDRVGLYLQNSPQFVIAFFGAARAGGVVVALNPMFKQAELEYEINDAGCRFCLAAGDLYPELAKVRSRVNLDEVIVTWLGEYCPDDPYPDPPAEVSAPPEKFSDVLELSELLASAPDRAAGRFLDMKDLALLQYTGGTTGLPKGAMITHHALACAALAANSWFANSGRDVFLGVTPYFHIMGMVQVMSGPLAAGSRLALLSRFEPEAVARAITRHQVTAWVGATTMLKALLDLPDLEKYDFGSFRYLCTGGAPVSVELQKQIKALMPQAHIVEGYGLTETVSQGAAVTPLGGYRPGFVGVPHVNDLKIVDLQDGERELAPGEEGEITVKGPISFSGYWQQPEETAVTIRDGWVHTGDVGLMDEQGYVKLLGRNKELIKCSGFSVFPTEVEVLLARHPAVADVAVIGVPDPYRGESPKAFVVLRAEFAGRVSESEMVGWARENMSAYKYPRDIEFREELPKSAVGKLLRRLLV